MHPYEREKKMKTARMAVIIVILFAVTGVLKADLTGYTASSTSNSVVYLTNFDTGEQTTLGLPSGIDRIKALEVSPVDGELYAIGGGNKVSGYFSRELYRIDRATGVGQFVGTMNSKYFQDLSFAPTGQLYGVAGNDIYFGDTLYNINLTNGAATSVGSLSPFTATLALAIDNTGKGIGWDSGAKWLYKINITDGSTTSLGQLAGNFDAFDYSPDGTLYGWAGNALYSINTETVTSTYLRNFSISGRSITMVPEPSTLALWLLFGIVGGVITWRKR